MMFFYMVCANYVSYERESDAAQGLVRPVLQELDLRQEDSSRDISSLEDLINQKPLVISENTVVKKMFQNQDKEALELWLRRKAEKSWMVGLAIESGNILMLQFLLGDDLLSQCITPVQLKWSIYHATTADQTEMIQFLQTC